jgi:16S rRNA (guanine(966)-N(2))-methyltransferase RsmD
MRIIAGSAKGRVLRSLKGRALRPTADRVRESLFATLAGLVEGARFLDLFAGAGSVGLEALSRGAADATFVEAHRPAGRVIEENGRRCGFADRVRVMIAPVARGLAVLRREGASFDIVFADPPYESGDVGAVLARLSQWSEMVAGDGMIVIQRSRREDPGERAGPFGRMRSMSYGETVVDIFRHATEAAGEPRSAGPC